MDNRKQLLATLICSGAIVASVNVIAQSYAQNARQGLDTSDSAAAGKSESSRAAFRRLDTNRRGYLTSEDVGRLQGFDSSCDRNSDGRITRSEFHPCWTARNRSQSVAPSTGSAPDATGSGSTPGTMGSGAGSPGITPGTTGSGSSDAPGSTGSGTGSTWESGSPNMPGSAPSGAPGGSGSGSGR